MDLLNSIYLGAGVIGGVLAGLIIQMVITRVRGNKVAAAAGQLKKNAEREAAQMLREARITAKSDALKIKDEIESELKERRKEVSQQEKRLTQKEENLERKADALDAKIKSAENKEHELDQQRDRLKAKEEELKKTISKQVDELERIASLDRETAKKMILDKLKGEVEVECGNMIRDLVDEAKQRCERESQQLLIQGSS